MNEFYNEYLAQDKKILTYRAQINFNITPIVRSADDIEFIIFHGTGNQAKTADDYEHYKYFKSTNRNSSADFFVDHDSITKLNDYYKNYTWHCGDWARRGLKAPKIPCYNKNSIAIEICVNYQNVPAIMDKTIENAIELGIVLKRYLPNAKIARHYDVTGKYCPADILVDKSNQVHPKWKELLSRVV